MKNHLIPLTQNIQKGIFFVVKLDFNIDGINPILVSTQERTTNLGTAYGYVESFNNLNSLNRVSGFGVSQDLEITINDITGYFQDVFLRGSHFSGNKSSVYIGHLGSTTLYKIADLEIDTINYDNIERKMFINLVSPDRNISIGDTPDYRELYIDNSPNDPIPVDLLKKLHNGKTLPNIFGTVEKIPIEQMYNDIVFQVKEEVETATLEKFNLRLYHELQLYIPTNLFESEQNMYIIGDDQGPFVVRFKGHITESTHFSEGLEYNLYFHRDTATDNFFPAVFGTDSDYMLKIIREQTFFYDENESFLPGRLQFRLAPISIDGGPDSFIPWLKNMFIKIVISRPECVYDFSSGEYHITGYPYFSYSPWFYIAEQNNDIVTLGNASMIGLGSMPLNITGVNELKMTLGKCYTIREGTEVIVLDILKKFGIYIVDMKEDTEVTGVYVDDTDSKYMLVSNETRDYSQQLNIYEIPASNYTVYHTDGTDANRLFNGTKPYPCTYIRFDPYILPRFKLTDATSLSGSMETFEPLVSVRNNYNTLLDVINYLTTRYGDFPTVIMDGFNAMGMYKDLYLNFALIDGEPLYDIISEICWQLNAATRETIRNDEFAIEIVPLNDPNLPYAYYFDKNNIIENTLVLSYSPKEDIRTVFKITKDYPDYLVEPGEEIITNNTDVYKESEYSVNYFIWPVTNPTKTGPRRYSEDRYRQCIDFWVERLSNSWLEISLTTTIETCHLEIWDRVVVTIPRTQYYSGASTQTLLDKIDDSTDDFKFAGMIREINTDFDNGTITYIIRTETKMPLPR